MIMSTWRSWRLAVLLGLLALAATVALAVLAVQPAGGQLADSPWPMFQHDPQHTGRSPFVGPQSNTVTCDFPVSGSGMGSPAIAPNGTIYVPSGASGDAAGFLHAVNPDCTQKWVFGLPGPPASTAPAIAHDGTIYVHANGPGNIVSIETLTAVNPDGSLKWQFEFNAGLGIFTSSVQSSPAVGADGTIWIGSIDTNIYGLNPDGTVKCAVSPALSSISTSPAIGPDGTIYIVDATTTLFAFTPNCILSWSFQLSDTFAGAANWQSPSIGADGSIYVGSVDRKLYAINPNGTLKCNFVTGWPIKSTPAIAADGTIYVGSDGLYALNSDCTQKWKFPGTPPALFSNAAPVIGADGTIYWRTSFRAYAVNPDGTQKWSLTVEASGGGLDPSGAIGADGVQYQGSGGQPFGSPVLRFIGPLTPPTLGDVNCDGIVNVIDALFILQYEVGLRVDTDQCPLPPPPPDTLNVANCDVNDDGLCNVVDALFILQCEVGISNAFCPLIPPFFQAPEEASSQEASPQQSSNRRSE